MGNKCKIFKKRSRQSGITLVALVVTIVVLLILAGVSLSLVLRNDGIIGRAKESGTEYAKGKANEQTELDTAEDDIDRALGTYDPFKKITAKTLEEAKSDSMLESNEESKVKFTDGTVIIPKGYKISNVTAEDVGHGVVIEDARRNQWVWVPVDDASKYYESSENGVAISGSTVKTNKYTKLSIELGTGSNKKTITRGLPSSEDYREPALVADYDSDANAVTAGFASASDMATKMVSEYETMIKSIEKYKGFYIGRYELSGSVKNPAEKSGKTLTTLTGTSWYDLYNACKKLGANADESDKEGIATRMIWGCQWDATCDFIATKGDGKDITDSSTWGNYSNYNTANNYTEGTKGYEKKAGTELNTGSSENWKANNIYDIAGNCFEWTQEARNTNGRAVCGGYYTYSGSNYPASYHNFNRPTGSSNVLIRFSSHFNNYNWHLERENQWKKIQ